MQYNHSAMPCLSHPEDQHFFRDQQNVVSDLKSWNLRIISTNFFIKLLDIIFVRTEIQAFLKFLRLEISDESGSVLTSRWVVAMRQDVLHKFRTREPGTRPRKLTFLTRCSKRRFPKTVYVLLIFLLIWTFSDNIFLKKKALKFTTNRLPFLNTTTIIGTMNDPKIRRKRTPKASPVYRLVSYQWTLYRENMYHEIILCLRFCNSATG